MLSVLMGPTNRIKVHSYRRVWSQGSVVNYLNIPGLIGPLGPVITAGGDNTDVSGYWQPILPHFFKDTTDRTRLIGSKLGESEFFQGHVYSPPRDISEVQTLNSIFDIPPDPPRDEPYFATIHKGEQVDGVQFGPFAAALGTDSFESLVRREKELMAATMQKYVLPMYKGITPEARNYSLFRNVVELRDVPRGILQLKSTLENFIKLADSINIPSRLGKVLHNTKTSLSDIPKEYLSYHFGWKQTFKDVMDLLEAPSKISKQVNLLIERSGKASTYRSKRQFPSTDENVPGFTYVTNGMDRNLKISSRIDRVIELRMVVNSTFTFPPAAEILVRKELFLDKLGLFPRFIDIYNLIPWTWLVDWYTGLGNYLEIIENINRDRSIVNWAMLTGVSKGKLTTELKSSQIDHRITSFNLVDNAPPTDIVTVRETSHQSTYDFTYRKRQDVSTILDVSSISDTSSLSTYQQSILAAILATMIDFKHKPRNIS